MVRRARARSSERRLEPAGRVRVAEEVLGWLRVPTPSPWTAPLWRGDEWAAARFAVQVHGIEPTLHARLAGVRTSDARAVAFLSYLAHGRETHALRHVQWQQELEGLLLDAARAGVRLLGLKDAVLLPFVGSDPARRPARDIDLLAHPSDRASIDAACARRGWLRRDDSARHRTSYCLARPRIAPIDNGRPIDDGGLMDDGGEPPDRPLRLAIHERAVQAFFDLRHDMTEALWRDATEMRIGDAPILVPAAEAAFEHALLHTAFDLAKRRTGFVTLEDLRLMAAALPEGAWEGLVARARATALERFYLAPLIMAERYARGDDGPFRAPRVVMEALQAATPPGLVAWLRQTPLSAFTACGSAGAPATNVWWRLRWFPAGRERVAKARQLLAPSRAELAARAPADGASSLWTYYRAQLARWRR